MDSNYRAKIRAHLISGLSKVVRIVTGGQIKVEDENGKIHWTRVTPPAPTPPPVPTPPPPTPTPPPSNPLLGKYRILRDTELPPIYGLNGKSRTAAITWLGGQMTPATCRIRGIASNGPISADGQAMVEKLDKPEGTFGYVTGDRKGWVNRGSWPDAVEGLTFEDNYVDVIKVDVALNRAYIRLWHGEGPEDECVVHKFTNIDKSGRMFGTQNPGGSGLGYIVLDYSGTKWGGPAWIELDKLVKV